MKIGAKARITRLEKNYQGDEKVRTIYLKLVGIYKYHMLFRHQGAGYLESFTNAEINTMKMEGEFVWR